MTEQTQQPETVASGLVPIPAEVAPEPTTTVAVAVPLTPETPSEPTVTAVGGAEVKMVEIPKDVYEEAQEDNRQRNFVHAILEARAPDKVKEYVTPPVPVAIAEQTRLEMEAGRKRVAEFAATEDQRRAVTEAHKNDKWAQPKSEAVFRPADFVPDPRKGQGNVGGTSVAV